MKFSVDEIKAIEGALPFLGKHVAESGIGDKAFNELSRDEALALVAQSVRGFREAFNDIMGDIPF